MAPGVCCSALFFMAMSLTHGAAWEYRSWGLCRCEPPLDHEYSPQNHRYQRRWTLEWGQTDRQTPRHRPKQTKRPPLKLKLLYFVPRGRFCSREGWLLNRRTTHVTSKQVNCHSLRMKASFEWKHGHVVLGWLGRLFVISRWGGWWRTGCVNRHNNTCTWWNRFSSQNIFTKPLFSPMPTFLTLTTTLHSLHATCYTPRAAR